MAMSMEEFSQVMLTKVRDNMDRFSPELKDTVPQIVHVTKNNDTELVGISFRYEDPEKCPMGAAFPTAYLNEAYDIYCEHGVSALEELGDNLVSIIAESDHKVSPDIADLFEDAEKIKKLIGIKLINKDANEEFLKDKPYRQVEDLAIIYTVNVDEYVVNEAGVTASITLTDSHVRRLGLSADELYDIAMTNLESREYSLKSMTEVMLEMMPAIPELREQILMQAADGPQLYVLTNESKTNGAAMLFNEKAMEEAMELYPNGFVILPSSIHECILAPADLDKRELKLMVGDVNESVVSDQEILSNNIYEYDFMERTIRAVDFENVKGRDENDDYDEHDL